MSKFSKKRENENTMFDVIKFVSEVCRVGGHDCVKLGANSTGYC